MRVFDTIRGAVSARQSRNELRQLDEQLKRHLMTASHQQATLTQRIVASALAPFYSDDAPDFLIDVLHAVVTDIIEGEGVFAPSPFSETAELSDVWRLTEHLQNRIKFFEQRKRHELFESVIIQTLTSVLEQLPLSSLFSDEQNNLSLTTSMNMFLTHPAHVVQGIIATYFDDEVTQRDLFPHVRNQLELNLYRASGIDPARAHDTRKSIVFPHEASDQTPASLVANYLAGTVFAELLALEVPFTPPAETRYTHRMVTGGSGHGKSQLLQQFLLPDLAEVQSGAASVVVIDSQGDMLNTIMHLAEFDPDYADSLAERLVLIDPNDIEAPPCLNLFDVGLARLDTYNALEREKLMNGAIALYEYMFGALLGATLTQRQGVIFKYLARLLMVVPEANIHTLRHFMEEPEATKHHLADLEGSARAFFETQFLSSSFDDTRQQILTRLWGVLSNPVLERMFVNKKNKVNMFDALNSGKVVLINTAKDLLKQDGCEIVGRFFIALIVQAIQERAAIPQHQRVNTWVYIDEAQDYFSEGDTQLEVLFSQARKYKAGITIANQTLAQLPRDLLYSVLASTSTKLAGGTSARDAATLAKEMRCDPEFLQDMRKREHHTEFACHIKNVTERPLRLTVPFGQMERRPKLSREAHNALLAINRSRYCATGDDQAQATPSKAPATGFDLGEYEPL